MRQRLEGGEEGGLDGGRLSGMGLVEETEEKLGEEMVEEETTTVGESTKDGESKLGEVGELEDSFRLRVHLGDLGGNLGGVGSVG